MPTPRPFRKNAGPWWFGVRLRRARFKFKVLNMDMNHGGGEGTHNHECHGQHNTSKRAELAIGVPGLVANPSPSPGIRLGPGPGTRLGPGPGIRSSQQIRSGLGRLASVLACTWSSPIRSHQIRGGVGAPRLAPHRWLPKGLPISGCQGKWPQSAKA